MYKLFKIKGPSITNRALLNFYHSFDVPLRIELGANGNFLFQNLVHTLLFSGYNSYNPGQIGLKSYNLVKMTLE